MSYQPKTYRTNGGDKLVIASGGEIDVESGGDLKLAGVALAAKAEDINAGVSLVGAMTGGSGTAAYGTDTSGDNEVEVLSANAEDDGARAILLIVKCTETFSTSNSTHAKFEIGDGTVDAEFATIGDGGDPDTMTKGDIKVYAGELTEERPIEITVTAGDADGGALQVFAIALPASTA